MVYLPTALIKSLYECARQSWCDRQRWLDALLDFAGRVQQADPVDEMRPGFHFAGTFDTSSLASMNTEPQAPGQVRHVGIRENELAGPLPALTQLPLLATATTSHSKKKLTQRNLW
jgi:hypothetical protein